MAGSSACLQRVGRGEQPSAGRLPQLWGVLGAETAILSRAPPPPPSSLLLLPRGQNWVSPGCGLGLHTGSLWGRGWGGAPCLGLLRAALGVGLEGPGCVRARARVCMCVSVCLCVCVCLGVAAADTCRPHPGLSATSVGVSGGGEGHRKLRFCESESQPFPLPGRQPPTCCRTSSWRVVGSRLQPHSPALWGPGGCWGLFASALGSRPQLCLRLLHPPIQVRAGWTWDRVSQVRRGCTLRLSRPPSAPAPLPAWRQSRLI